MLTLRLFGTVTLTDDEGHDRTPRGAKARAALAMVAMVPEQQRNRRWLEAKLWSDRAPEQASGSLRQVLVQIRQALGPHADCLNADRSSVTLSGIETDRIADARAREEGREFLEGIDIADPEFEHWLVIERSRLSPRQSAAPRGESAFPGGRLALTINGSGGADATSLFMGRALADSIGALVSEFADVDVFAPVQPGPAETTEVVMPKRGLTITVDCIQEPAGYHIRINLASTQSGKVYWSRRTRMDGSAADVLAGDAFPAAVFQAADATYATAATLPAQAHEEIWADGLIASAVRSMYTFDKDRLAIADEKLARAIDLSPTPRAYAWRAQLRQIMAVERTNGDWVQLSADADEYSRKALESPEQNSLVLSLSSQIRVMLDNDPGLGLALAQNALEISPHNAFGLAALSGAHLRNGAFTEALAAARTGSQLAARTTYSAWWQALAGLAAMSMGQLDEATGFYQAAHARSPYFRAPLRHLLVLYSARGDHERAQHIHNLLVQLEPDFTLDRLRYDPSYPAATLRRSALIERVEI